MKENLVMAKFYLILFILLSFAQVGSAYEMRVWEDKDGNQYKGRFVKEIFGKLTIEDEEGNTHILVIDDLSELDKKYTRTMVPPNLTAEVFRKTRQLPTRERPRRMVTKDAYQLRVEIQKKSQRPFTSRLRAELFMIGEENISGNYVLMDLTTEDFLFPIITKNAKVEFSTAWVPYTTFQGVGRWNDARLGQDYAGYLLVISTLEGDICFTDTSLRPWIEEPEVIQKLRDLWMTGRPTWLARLFDEEGNKLTPPRPPAI